MAVQAVRKEMNSVTACGGMILFVYVEDRIVTCYRADAVDHQNYTTRQQYTLMQANSSENSQSHHVHLSFQHTCMLIYTYT